MTCLLLWPHSDEVISMHDPPCSFPFHLLTGFWASFSLHLPLVISPPNHKVGFPCGSVVKSLPANAGDVGSIPGSERSLEKEMATLSWKITWQRSLAGYSSWDCKRVRWLSNSTKTTTNHKIIVTDVNKDVDWESVRTSWKDLYFLSFSVEGSPKSLENEDFSSSSAITVFKDTSQGAVDQLSLILSPEHQISQLYIPRSSATAALGAAARLATSKSLLHWYPSVKKVETWGQWGGKISRRLRAWWLPKPNQEGGVETKTVFCWQSF